MNRSHEKSQRPWGKNVRSRCSHWTLKRRLSFSLCILGPSPSQLLSFRPCPLSRSFSIFGRVRDISESLTAIKTLIKWEPYDVAEGRTWSNVKRISWGPDGEWTRRGRERTSCGESILLRRRLRGPTSSSSSFPPHSSPSSSHSLYISLLSRFLSLTLREVLWLPFLSSQCLSTCLLCVVTCTVNSTAWLAQY